MKAMLMLMASLLAGCTAAMSGVSAGQVPAVPTAPVLSAQDAALAERAARYDLAQPYLAGPMADGTLMVPPPPAAGSARLARDHEVEQSVLAAAGGARWQMAARDADLSPGWYDRAFSCATGRVIDAASAPAIANLLRHAAGDFGSSTSIVKDQYARARPFMDNGHASCTPGEDAMLRTNGSYPSGHSAIGYGTGLVLASLFPDHAAALVARGRAFGESRAQCNVHWTSDVEEGQMMAAATFARLQVNAAYRADFAAAQAEAATLSAAPDAARCAADALVLAGG